MDVIIKGIFASKHPHDMKLTFLKRIVENCPSQGAYVNKRVFHFCCLLKLDTSSSTQVQLADYVLDGWSTTNIGDAWLYLLNELLPDKDGKFSKVNNSEKACAGRVHLVTEFLRILHTKDSTRVVQTAPAVTWKLSFLYTKCEDLQTFGKMVTIFDAYPLYLAQCGHIPDLIAATASFLARLEFSNKEKKDLLQTLASVTVLSDFIGKILTERKELMCVVMNEVFSHMYDINSCPSSCLASLLTHFPNQLVDNIAKRVTKDGALANDKMAIIVGRMIEWISWPGVKNLSEWIMGFLKALYLEKRYSVICTVIEEKAAKIFGYVVYPLYREHAVTISSYLLIVYQHDPQVFHKVVPLAVSMLTQLAKEKSESSQSAHHSIVELMFTLMYQFPGFPDVYSPLIEVLKNEDRPPESKKKQWLSTSKFAGLEGESTLMSVNPARSLKSETGKVGLVNLGNTCYMNSIVQALFMLKRFRHRILNTRFSPLKQPVSFHLQKLFGLLLLSERPAISPTQFHVMSRPTWFSPGAQQDCSEFLKHLLDCLEREDSSHGVHQAQNPLTACLSSVCAGGAAEGSGYVACNTSDCEDDSVSSLFCGEAAVCTRCLSCQGISCKREAFNDISLSFPDQTSEQAKGLLLKGGDQSCNPYGSAEDRSKSSIGGSETLSDRTTLETLHSEETQMENLDMKSQTTPSTSHTGTEQRPLLSVQSLLQSALNKEVLTTTNQYYCDGCSSLQDAERKMTIVSAPQYLVLTLNRFTYDVKSHTRSKVLQNLEYPSWIDLKVYSRDVVDNQTDMEHIFQSSATSEAVDDPPTDSVEMRIEKFELCSIVVHSGVSSDCGHYYCYCAERTTNDTTATTSVHVSNQSLPSACSSTTEQPAEVSETWYMLNDCRVSITNRQAIARVSENFPRDTPYLLVYRNINSECGFDDNEAESVLEELNSMVDADNKRYLQERREQEARQKRKFADADLNNRFDKDGSAGGCGGSSSGGMGLNGPRFIC